METRKGTHLKFKSFMKEIHSPFPSVSEPSVRCALYMRGRKNLLWKMMIMMVRMMMTMVRMMRTMYMMGRKNLEWKIQKQKEG